MIGYLIQNHPLIQAFAPAPARRSRRESIATNRLFKTAPRLSDYFRAGEILAAKGSLDRPISGLAIDRRRVVPGAMFFVLPGRPGEGMATIDEAVSRGAVAMVVPRLPVLPPARVTFIQVSDTRATLAAVAQRFYRFPDRDLTVVGVTGTSGKTSVAHLLQQLLHGDQRVGLISTIHYDLGARTVPALRPAPESLDVFGMMAQMRDAGCRHAVLEVSAPGFSQPPVKGMQFGAVVFTGLARDVGQGNESRDDDLGLPPRGEFSRGPAVSVCISRLTPPVVAWRSGGVPPPVGAGTAPFLDPHADLRRQLGDAPVSVVNLDDAGGRALAARLAAEMTDARLITYGESPAAQVRAEGVRLQPRNTTFRLVWPGGTLDVDSPLIGRSNVSNLLAAVATAWGLGRDPLVVLARFRAFPGVPGRLERIAEGQDFNVVVDSAHTADSLRHALGVLRSLTPGRLLVVFGCGGNQDRALRPLLTHAVQELADHAVATADNPRSEAVARIFADMRAGVSAPERITWIDDRRRAIGAALDLARPGDCVLIAGKGHESCQEMADTVFPFDDRLVARELLRDKRMNGGT